MKTLQPLESLYDVEYGRDLLRFPPELAKLYGSLGFPRHSDRPYILGNFVTTLDGVVELDVSSHPGGGDISGFNQTDRMVMGILRAIADAIIVGAGTLRASTGHRWTAEHIYPPLAHAYQELRISQGKTEPPLNVIVSAQGGINFQQPLFQSGQIPVLIVTTPNGAQHLQTQQPLPSTTQMRIIPTDGPISAHDIVQAVRRIRPCHLILVEGGPRLMGDFFAEHYLDELFLTLAPQIAGRDSSSERPGLVTGKLFAPDHPVWGKLIGIKRAENHLFLRYAFESAIH